MTRPQERTPQKKQATLLHAVLPIVVMMALLGVGYIIFDLPAEPMIIVAAVVAGIIAIYLGYTYSEIMDSVAEKIAKVMPALLILVTVGLMIGAWMAGGTIPMIIYYGLEIISPQYLYVTALVVTSLVAASTGTSWGAAGTIGVAFMGVAIGMDGINLAVVAGAVVSGAYFGDKLSPLSDTTNLAAAVTQVNLFEHIKHLLYTTVPSWITAGVVFLVVGLRIDAPEGVGSAKVAEINSALSAGFDWNIWLLVPVLVVLVGSMMKKPTIPVMLLASALAMINALVFQGISLADTIGSIVGGFDISMITGAGFDAENVVEDIPTLLNRGGMSSMMGTLLIAFIAIAFAGVLSVTKSLDLIIDKLLGLAKSTGSLILATIAIGLTTIATTCNGQISILMPGELLRGAYIKRGLHPKNLGRTVEDSATIIEPILPWTAAGAYMAGTLGVATLDYLPWAILCWTGIVFATIWGYTGFGIAKLTPEEQATMLAEIEAKNQTAGGEVETPAV